MPGLSRNYVIEEHSASGTEAGHTSLKLDFHPPDGMIGNRMCEDRAASAKTRLRAMRGCCHSPSGSPEFGLTSKCGKLLQILASRKASGSSRASPEFGLTSKCGKLLLDMSRRGRCPRQNKLAIGNSSMVIA